VLALGSWVLRSWVLGLGSSDIGVTSRIDKSQNELVPHPPRVLDGRVGLMPTRPVGSLRMAKANT
jgi:hypothetical protein